MRLKNLAVVLPLERGFSSLVRVVGAVMIGGILGLALSFVLPLPPELAILAGLVMGVLVGSPERPFEIEDWLGRGILSLGGAFLAGFFFYRGMPAQAWLVFVCTVAFAGGVAAGRWWHAVIRWLVAVALLALILYVLSTWFYLEPVVWGGSELFCLVCLGLGLALAIWIATRIDIRPILRSAGRQSVATPKPGKSPTRSKDLLFGPERAALGDVAARVEMLVKELVSAAPEEAEFVDQIRTTLKDTLAQADESIARWRAIRKPSNSERSRELQERIDANQERLAATTDESVRRALDLTLQRQRLTLAQYQRMEAAQRAFGLRLQQVHSGLELLELALERVLTASGAVSSDDVDAIVDAMNEVNAMFDFEHDGGLPPSDLPEGLVPNGPSVVS